MLIAYVSIKRGKKCTDSRGDFTDIIIKKVTFTLRSKKKSAYTGGCRNAYIIHSKQNVIAARQAVCSPYICHRLECSMQILA